MNRAFKLTTNGHGGFGQIELAAQAPAVMALDGMIMFSPGPTADAPA